ncbi:MAG: MFS transporter [Pseudomonadota bacterium]
MEQEEKRVIGLITSSHSLVHLYEGVIPPLIPLLIGVFGTDYFHLGVLVSIFSYAFGFGSLPAGFLADKVGPRRLITLYLFGSGLLSLCVLPVRSFFMYGVIMGLLGLFCSTYHPASNTLIAYVIRQKGRAFGIHGIAGSLGVATVPLISAWIGSTMGWKAPHVIFGILGLVVGAFSMTLPKWSPKGDKVAPAKKQGAEGERMPYLTLVVFFTSTICLGLTYKGVMTFLPAYMGQNVHVSFLKFNTVTLGGTIATLALLSGAIGQYLAGRLLDHYRAERLYLGALIFGTVFIFLMAQSLNIFLVIWAVLYAFFYFSTQPIQNYLLSQYIPKDRQGFGFGLLFFLSFGVGSTAAAVCGYLADHFGLQSVFYAMGGCFIVSTCLVSYLVVKGRSKPFMSL